MNPASIDINQLKRESPAVYDAAVNLGIMIERTRVVKHIDVAMKYDASLRSVKNAVVVGTTTVNIEAVHDHYIEAVEREEQAELEAASSYG